MNTITISLEGDDNKEVNFNGETLTLTLQFNKKWTINWAFKKLKLIVIALVKNSILSQNCCWWDNI